MQVRRLTFYVLFFLSLFGVLGFSYVSSYLAEKPPVVQCQARAFKTATDERYYTNPEKLVVQPWRGPHNVYAIFTIPSGYRSDGLFTVSIPGDQIYCGQFFNAGRVFTGVEQPKYYTLIKGNLNTRIALKLIAQGKLDHLKEAQNWRLGYIKSRRKS